VIDFSELYRTHAGDVHRFALFLSGDPALADDILSETFIRLWHARERVDLTTVKGYLLAIARNLFLADRRHARRITTLDERVQDNRPGPERRAHAHLELQAVPGTTRDAPPTAEKQTLDATRQLLKSRTSTLVVAAIFTVLPLAFAFHGTTITFLVIRDAPVIGITWWVTAVIMWIWHVRIRRRLRVSGLEAAIGPRRSDAGCDPAGTEIST